MGDSAGGILSRWKFFNFRPLFFAFAMVVIGILSANHVRSKFYLAIGILLLTVFLLLFYSIKIKKFSILLAGLILLTLGVGDFYLEKSRLEQHTNFSPGEVVVGVVDSVTHTRSGLTIYTRDVFIDNKGINGNCVVYFSKNEILDTIEVGHKITFVAEDVQVYDLYNEEIPTAQFIKKNIKYQIYTTEIVTCERDEKLNIKLQQRIKDNLALGLDTDKASLIYSTLFGDKTELNLTTKESFSNSGVAHLLAVSGLHVGLIVSVLILILKKLNKYARFIFIFIFLMCYCYLCNWTPSIVRATIMSTVLLGAPLVFSEYDSLSSISFAGVIILLISPSALFDISFLLSFMCVLGISMFYPYFEKFLNKIHFNNAVSKIFAISTIVHISTLFVMLYYFEMDNFIGILANIFILPIFTFVFSVVFVISLFSLLIPALSYSIIMIAPLINLVILLSNFFASIGHYFSAIPISFLSVILYTILLLFLSKFNVKNVVVKSISVSVVAIILVCQIVLYSQVLSL